MDSKELRIGNYINFVNTLSEVFGITSKEVMFKYSTGSEEKYAQLINEGIRSVKLTEEWLLEFGFNYRDAKYWIDGLCIHTSDKDFYILQEQGRVFIKSVHQLQNLFFALKGKELTLK